MNNNLSNALAALKEYGAEIEDLGNGTFAVEDTGIWGLIEDAGTMILGEDDIVELAEQYTEFEAE